MFAGGGEVVMLGKMLSETAKMVSPVVVGGPANRIRRSQWYSDFQRSSIEILAWAESMTPLQPSLMRSWTSPSGMRTRPPNRTITDPPLSNEVTREPPDGSQNLGSVLDAQQFSMPCALLSARSVHDPWGHDQPQGVDVVQPRKRINRCRRSPRGQVAFE